MTKFQKEYEDLLFLYHSGLCANNSSLEMINDGDVSDSLDTEDSESLSNETQNTYQNNRAYRNGSDSKRSEMGSPNGKLNTNKDKLLQRICNDLRDVHSLNDLRKYIKEFRDFELARSANQAVFSDGNDQADVVIVGEAPGAEEDIQGLPFVGRAGRLLDEILHFVGLDRGKSVYITNVVSWRPPNNRTPTNDELELCIPLICKHLELCQARYAVLLGAVALRALTDCDEGIIRSRGRWFERSFGKRSVKLLATFHPAFLLRQPLRRREFWMDFLSLSKQLLTKN